MEKLALRIHNLLASTKFFVATVLLFVVQSVWLACTAIYPLPFDEFVHVGVIQLYARQWLPVIAQQPAGTGVLGDVTREPSFLYHYLMSFPYRFFDIFTDNQAVLIVATRLLNVVFVAVALILFRKLLLRWGVSRRLTHAALLAFVSTPIVPFLAAHVSYDNLMLLLTPVFLLQATELITGRKDFLKRSLLLVLTGMTALLIKQTFLPLAGIVLAYAAIVIWRRNRGKLLLVCRKAWRRTPKDLSFALILLGLGVVGGLFAERYGGNVVQYGSIRPSCEVVQPRSLCEDFGPWYRDKVLNVQNRPPEAPYGNPFSFSQYWFSRMMRGFYAIFMHTPTRVVSDLEPFGPIELKSLLPLPLTVGYLALVTGLTALVLQWKRLWRQPYLRFGVSISGMYLAILWLFNYLSYLRLWKAEAIQARYTLPILIIVFVVMLQAVSWTIADRRFMRLAWHLKACLLLAFALTYVWGGGTAGWLIRAEDTWRWQNPTVQSVNHRVQTVLRWTVVH
ncbi:MAG TPA: hypothetical protein VK674_05695 [Candidatus Limnocylindria bacterium]|nr:hypothetical protein [Candidatus Limnocylindria bacterium]